VLPPHPETSGGFGDVYRGLLGEQPVAVKVSRIYQMSDRERLLKVVFVFVYLVEKHDLNTSSCSSSHEKRLYGDSYLIPMFSRCLACIIKTMIFYGTVSSHHGRIMVIWPNFWN
jgi:hypothetical protein